MAEVTSAMRREARQLLSQDLPPSATSGRDLATVPAPIQPLTMKSWAVFREGSRESTTRPPQRSTKLKPQ